jgi:alpha-L-fucosidase 2
LDGAIWFRNSFELPEAWAGKNLVLELGRVRDLDVTYVNGKKIGSTEGTSNREYVIDANVLRKGKNEILVQVINFYDKGGMVGARGGKKAFLVHPQGEDPSKGIVLPSTWKYWIQDETPPAFPRYMADYQPFGDVFLKFENQKPVTYYRRELDLRTAISRVWCIQEGVKFTREYFASAPHQAIVMHIEGDKPGKVSLSARLNSVHTLSSTRKQDESTLSLTVQVRNGALRGVSYLRVEVSGGKVKTTGDEISIEKADEATFYLVAATNFKNYKDVSGDPQAICESTVRGLQGKEYAEIRSEHIKEYQQYFNTLSLDLGAAKTELLPTNERIAKFAGTPDPALLTLYLQYGRYLLISSSRPGTGPANLQGIWNNLLTPPWGSKYTTNINAEMNYWPSEILNLSSCSEPLFGLIDDVAETGAMTAKAHYGAPGWVVHHNTDLWRGTAPVNASNHGIWVTGGAWLTQHLWEHYLFTQDKEFLQKRAYPRMKEAANFFVSFLVKDPNTGWLISTPSNSPEQGGLVAGPAMDHQIIRELFRNCVEASEILGVDAPFRQTLKEKLDHLAPDQIGKFGQLQEWLEDKDDTTNRHRHVSHLWAVYPGKGITWDRTPDLMKAARQSLIYRGDGGTGWSLAWKVNLWARFKDGDHSMRMVKALLSPAEDGSGGERGGVYRNLFDAHPPFQIDGNFGGAAGIAEMLVQSHMDYIDLLPALPSLLSDGEIRGICARGGFVLNLRWQKGKLQQVEVVSQAGKDCFLKYGAQEVRFPTRKGQTYKLNGNLKKL